MQYCNVLFLPSPFPDPFSFKFPVPPTWRRGWGEVGIDNQFPNHTLLVMRQSHMWESTSLILFIVSLLTLTRSQEPLMVYNTEREIYFISLSNPTYQCISKGHLSCIIPAFTTVYGHASFSSSNQKVLLKGNKINLKIDSTDETNKNAICHDNLM